ncbi:hypothetical protein AB870_07835 [Pandoraea faecigallinarum]|uniref:Transcription factor zinc-finger domain-containing protein n=1 Tax=Pandoraea faecigallinarum TaxID=656179 RepID=A0A0H3WQZ2_9BURK|nr:zf-TFIIB domain-containing protein [Pandoraea faecigallinarum]AKM30030.1 hypothetical protein AB870_07835 [Pandoraea faecigallinarum]
MKCPVCGTPDLLMAERQGVEIDYCPNCRGVWLDRGELDKLIERTDGMQGVSAPPPVVQRGFGREGHDGRAARESREYDNEYGGEYHGGYDKRDRDYRKGHRHGHDGHRRDDDRPRKKKSLFEIFDFD